MADDSGDLKLLSIFHYIVGAFMLLFSCMPLVNVGIGIFLIVSPETFTGNGGTQPPAIMGWLFAIIGVIFFLFGISISTCVLLSGRYLARKVKYMFSFVVACIERIFLPFGTILGVFTIIVSSRESVKKIYGRV